MSIKYILEMESETNVVGPLIERAEQYSKVTIELAKLKLIDKSADVSSTLLSRLFLTIVMVIFTITLTIAIALWLGDLLGKNYYGFLLITLFYGLIGVVSVLIHPLIKARISNMIIAQILN